MRNYICASLSIQPSYTSIVPIYDYDRAYYSHRLDNLTSSSTLSNAATKKLTETLFPNSLLPTDPTPDKPSEVYELSSGERRRLRYACNMLQKLAKPLKATNYKLNKKFDYQLAFITLTLPSVNHDISDNDVKNIYLKNFLQRLRRKYGLRHYVWKSEAQMNGNIHIHLTANIYVHYALLRREWLDCIRESGLLDKFYEKFGHRNAPATEIKSVKRIKNLGDYLINHYTEKKKNARKIEGKAWNCSESLHYNKRLRLSHSEVSENIAFYLLNDCSLQIKRFDYCDLYRGDLYRIKANENPEIYQITHQHLIELDEMVIQRNAIDQDGLLFQLLWKRIKPKIATSYRLQKQRIRTSLGINSRFYDFPWENRSTVSPETNDKQLSNDNTPPVFNQLFFSLAG